MLSWQVGRADWRGRVGTRCWILRGWNKPPTTLFLTHQTIVVGA